MFPDKTQSTGMLYSIFWNGTDAVSRELLYSCSQDLLKAGYMYNTRLEVEREDEFTMNLVRKERKREMKHFKNWKWLVAVQDS